MRQIGRASLLLALLMVGGCGPARRDPDNLPPAGAEEPLSGDPHELFARRDLDSVRRAVALWKDRGTTGPTALFELLRAQIWLCSHEPEPQAREAAAASAVVTARRCGGDLPKSAECAYWLAAALGVQAQQRAVGALGSLPRIEALFLQAAETRPGLERGGPDRALAILYVRAPGFPVGPGDPDLAVDHARRAIDVDPIYPPNLLALGEALIAAGDGQAGQDAYREALGHARERQTAGDPDAPEWVDEARAILSQP